MFRFRLVRGKHAHGGKVYSADGQMAGNIIITDIDLSKLNAAGAIKFERMDDPEQTRREASVRGVSMPPDAERISPAAFPGGQVSTGLQASSGRETGTINVTVPFDDEGNVLKENVQQDQRQLKEDKDDTDDDFSFSPAEILRLNSMTFAQLKEFAADEEIDLGNARTKDAALKAIGASRRGTHSAPANHPNPQGMKESVGKDATAKTGPGVHTGAPEGTNVAHTSASGQGENAAKVQSAAKAGGSEQK